MSTYVYRLLLTFILALASLIDAPLLLATESRHNNCEPLHLLESIPESTASSRPIGTFVDLVVPNVVFRPAGAQVLLAADDSGRKSLEIDDELTLIVLGDDGTELAFRTWTFASADKRRIEAMPPQVITDLLPEEQEVRVRIVVQDLYPPYHSASPLVLVFWSPDQGVCSDRSPANDTPTVSVATTIEPAATITPAAGKTQPAAGFSIPTVAIAGSGQPPRSAVTSVPTSIPTPSADFAGPSIDIDAETAERSESPSSFNAVGSSWELPVAGLVAFGALAGLALVVRRRRVAGVEIPRLLEFDVIRDGRLRRISPLIVAPGFEPDAKNPHGALILRELGLRAEVKGEKVSIRPLPNACWDGWLRDGSRVNGDVAVELHSGERLSHPETQTELSIPSVGFAPSHDPSVAHNP